MKHRIVATSLGFCVLLSLCSYAQLVSYSRGDREGSSSTKEFDGFNPETPDRKDDKTADVSAKRRQTSGRSAASQDDNRQFNYFIRFLEEYKDRVAAYPLPVQERIKLFSIGTGDLDLDGEYVLRPARSSRMRIISKPSPAGRI
ncbi:MAG: hypothetical protein JXD23_02690 [Spirochaetales bacterium]|nr:hypothetical protein [Spirochaetales bacterium]